MKKRLYLFDTEAEHLNLHTSRPWQIAILGDKYKFYEHIRVPNLGVSQAAARITGFNQEKHDRIAKPVTAAIEAFDALLEDEDAVFGGHNILGYDIYILANLYREVGRKLNIQKLALRFIDSLSLSRGYRYEMSPPKEFGTVEFLAWQYKMLSKFQRNLKTGLGPMCKEFDIEVDDSKTHDALYDISINKKLLLKLIYDFDISI